MRLFKWTPLLSPKVMILHYTLQCSKDHFLFELFALCGNVVPTNLLQYLMCFKLVIAPFSAMALFQTKDNVVPIGINSQQSCFQHNVGLQPPEVLPGGYGYR